MARNSHIIGFLALILLIGSASTTMGGISISIGARWKWSEERRVGQKGIFRWSPFRHCFPCGNHSTRSGRGDRRSLRVTERGRRDPSTRSLRSLAQGDTEGMTQASTRASASLRTARGWRGLGSQRVIAIPGIDGMLARGRSDRLACVVRHDPRVVGDPVAVLDEDTGTVIGIHTSGGCDEIGGSNLGTGVDNPADDESVRPDGSPMLPPMPYGYLAGMSAADLDAIVLYLRSLPGLPDAG